MPQVSKQELPREVEKKINNFFHYFFASLRDKKEAESVLEEFFTPTEIEMLSKRLALVYMISQEKSFSDLLYTLNVSPSTIARVSKIMDRGGYEEVKKLLLKCRADF